MATPMMRFLSGLLYQVLITTCGVELRSNQRVVCTPITVMPLLYMWSRLDCLVSIVMCRAQYWGRPVENLSPPAVFITHFSIAKESWQGMRSLAQFQFDISMSCNRDIWYWSGDISSYLVKLRNHYINKVYGENDKNNKMLMIYWKLLI